MGVHFEYSGSVLPVLVVGLQVGLQVGAGVAAAAVGVEVGAEPVSGSEPAVLA